MPRNRNFRKSSSGELVTIKQVCGGMVGRYRPGIRPQRVSEKWSFAWILDVRFAPEQVVRAAEGTLGIEITVEPVA